MRLGAPGFADGVSDATVAHYAQSLEAQWRAGTKPKQPFATFLVVGGYDDARMQVEASRVTAAPLGRRREGVVSVDGAASAWQNGQLAEAERASQAGIERRASGGVDGRLT